MVNGTANATAGTAWMHATREDRAASGPGAIQCPTCGQADVRTYGTFRQGEDTTRYHLCDDCGALFRSHSP